MAKTAIATVVTAMAAIAETRTFAHRTTAALREQIPIAVRADPMAVVSARFEVTIRIRTDQAIEYPRHVSTVLDGNFRAAAITRFGDPRIVIRCEIF
jgi:hypothetical protein